MKRFRSLSMALDDEVRPTPCDAFPASKADRGRKWNPFRAELKQFIARWAVACLLVPAVLAAIGSIMDKALFGDYNPNFHVRYLAFSGWVASPFVLLRWSYSGGKYLTVLRLAIYLLQTAGIICGVHEGGGFRSGAVPCRGAHPNVFLRRRTVWEDHVSGQCPRLVRERHEAPVGHRNSGRTGGRRTHSGRANSHATALAPPGSVKTV